MADKPPDRSQEELEKAVEEFVKTLKNELSPVFVKIGLAALHAGAAITDFGMELKDDDNG